jgi:hypothetical protein
MYPQLEIPSINRSSGNDAWNGLTAHHTASTLDGPKLTITNGVSNVDENGTLRIADGIYGEAQFKTIRKIFRFRKHF